MAQKISQMTEQTTASMTEAGTSDFLGGYTTTGGNANRKFSLSGLANYFLNKFKMTLGGSSQTVKSAIDALNSNKAEFKNLSIGTDSVGSLDDAKTVFIARAGAISSRAVSFFAIHFSADIAEFPGGGEWICKITKGTDIYWDVECTYASGYNANAIYPVFVKYENGAWTFKSLTSDITTLNSKLTVENSTGVRTDLNNVTDTGLYSYDALSSSMSNIPSTGTYFSGTLRVTRYQSGKILQEFIHSGGKMFIRHMWNGSWNSWTQL